MAWRQLGSLSACATVVGIFGIGEVVMERLSLFLGLCIWFLARVRIGWIFCGGGFGSGACGEGEALAVGGEFWEFAGVVEEDECVGLNGNGLGVFE